MQHKKTQNGSQSSGDVIYNLFKIAQQHGKCIRWGKITVTKLNYFISKLNNCVFLVSPAEFNKQPVYLQQRH